mgnify:CR=1 FL=1
MVTEMLVKVLVLGALFGVVCFVFFYWLNRKEGGLDRRSYDEDFDAGKMVSSYKYNRVTEDDLTDPEKELSAYKYRRPPPKKKN